MLPLCCSLWKVEGVSGGCVAGIADLLAGVQLWLKNRLLCSLNTPCFFSVTQESIFPFYGVVRKTVFLCVTARGHGAYLVGVGR